MSAENKSITAGAAAREISYSWSAKTRAGRTVVQAVENLTGRPSLLRMANGYEREVEAGRDFWEVMRERYGISIRFREGDLERIPKTGPLVLVANHPFGILDGLVMGFMLSSVRNDYRILANSVFKKAKDLSDVIVPISFDDDKDSMLQNRRSIRSAMKFVKSGGALGTFPSGTVATSISPFGKALDPLWPNTASAILTASNATCLPVFFHGTNSRLFQIASHIHDGLRLCLFVNEFKRRVNEEVEISIGKPIKIEDYKLYKNDLSKMSRFLRKETLSLGGLDHGLTGRQYLRAE